MVNNRAEKVDVKSGLLSIVCVQLGADIQTLLDQV